jgi:nucleotide-binding universal stress UspA family protein
LKTNSAPAFEVFTMAPKIILALLNDRRHVGAMLDRAMMVAKPQGAAIVALHVRPDPAAMMAQVDGQYFATMAASVFETIDREARESAQAVLDAVTLWCSTHGVAQVSRADGGDQVQLIWRDVVGQLEQIVVREGQLTDLILIGRPDKADAPLDEVALESALFGTGRPVLLCPIAEPASASRIALVAWNGSLEATRAVAAALPLLARMDRVDVVTIGQDGPGQISADDLANYLGAHGIKASATNIVDLSAPAGKMILDHGKAIGAGLIVMGAYTHSRVRELFLGGATREALRAATVPVLMTH